VQSRWEGDWLNVTANIYMVEWFLASVVSVHNI
jgi:hypothetical protein